MKTSGPRILRMRMTRDAPSAMPRSTPTSKCVESRRRVAAAHPGAVL